MQIKVCASGEALAETAAVEAAEALRAAVAANGSARLIAATGAAQFEFLDVLTSMPNIPWDKVEMFHLDEYLGIAESHPASFVRFLRERLVDKTSIRTAHMLDGNADPRKLIAAVTAEIRKRPIDVAFIGIGENGHLAFNDPPADFDNKEAFLVVELDAACRRQQLGEGWFTSIDAVPTQAISMTVQQMLKAKRILAIVPDKRKADAVAECFNGEISPMAPASILRTHANATVYLDRDSASLLQPETMARYET